MDGKRQRSIKDRMNRNQTSMSSLYQMVVQQNKIWHFMNLTSEIAFSKIQTNACEDYNKSSKNRYPPRECSLDVIIWDKEFVASNTENFRHSGHEDGSAPCPTCCWVKRKQDDMAIGWMRSSFYFDSLNTKLLGWSKVHLSYSSSALGLSHCPFSSSTK